MVSRKLLKRVGKRSPIGAYLLAGDLTLLAARHVGKLNGAQRRRLVDLLRRRATRSSLSKAEQQELSALLAALEPRSFVGSAVRRVSPLPVPKRLLH